MTKNAELLNNILIKGKITFIETFPTEAFAVAKIKVDEETCLSVVFHDNMVQSLTENFKKGEIIMLKALAMGELKGKEDTTQWFVCDGIYGKSIYNEYDNVSQFIVRGDILSIDKHEDSWMRIIIKTCFKKPGCTATFPIYLYTPDFDTEDIKVNDRLCFSGSIIGGHTTDNNSTGTYDFFMEVEEIFN